MVAIRAARLFDGTGPECLNASSDPVGHLDGLLNETLLGERAERGVDVIKVMASGGGRALLMGDRGRRRAGRCGHR